MQNHVSKPSPLRMHIDGIAEKRTIPKEKQLEGIKKFGTCPCRYMWSNYSNVKQSKEKQEEPSLITKAARPFFLVSVRSPRHTECTIPTQKKIINRDVVFEENGAWDWGRNDDHVTTTSNVLTWENDGEDIEGHEEDSLPEVVDTTHEQGHEEQESSSSNSSTARGCRTRREVRQPVYLQDYVSGDGLSEEEEEAIFGMKNNNRVNNPIVPGVKLSKKGGGAEVDITLYKQMIGSLMYLTVTRPDLIFVVCLASRYMSAPTEAHFQAYTRSNHGEQLQPESNVGRRNDGGRGNGVREEPPVVINNGSNDDNNGNKNNIVFDDSYSNIGGNDQEGSSYSFKVNIPKMNGE
ncbi:hypothetical protein KIW84_053759 [Lathyrus oleraceus]|uniref:Uncharacterized protein n=1 Tax=Pisum sativum TaxID=3888 RepID=A0A9D4WTT0_PEA|nr:hypothetical protein KIW84_053759 [Pisum sativum]